MTIEPDPNGISWAEREDPVTVEPPPTLRTGGIVDRLATRMSEREIAVALDLGHVAAFNVSATPARLSVANAHVWQETGRGQRGLYNFNFLNGDWLPGDPEARFPLVADEGYGAMTHSMRKFLRAYPDAFSGAVGYWRTMAKQYPSALPLFDAGDGDGAAREMKRLGFFSGNVEVYARALRLMAAEYLERVKKGSL